MKLLLKLTALCFAFTLAAAPAVVHAQDKAPSKSQKTDKSTNKSTTPKGSGKLDINTATSSELTKLPGIDSEAARRIIGGRPYDNKAQLKSRNIITEAVYDKITDQIIAKQPKKDSDSTKSDGTSKSKSKNKSAQ